MQEAAQQIMAIARTYLRVDEPVAQGAAEQAVHSPTLPEMLLTKGAHINAPN